SSDVCSSDLKEDGYAMRRLSRPPSLTVWVLWHAAAVVVMTLVPSQRGVGCLGALPPWESTFLVQIAATYVASILILTFWTRGGRTVSLPELVWIVSAVFGSYCLFLLLTESP